MTAMTYRVLLVEDNPADAFLVQQYFEEVADFEVDIVHVITIVDAIATLETRSFEVILLDLGLPDAFELSALERLNSTDLNIPIVVLTANTSIAVSLKALDLGAQDYLIKDDINPQSLSLAVRFALERHQYVEQLLVAQRNTLNLKLQFESERFFRELMTNIQHEFRTPLSIIQGSASIIRMNPKPDSIDKHTQRIESAVDRLVGISEYLSKLAHLASLKHNDEHIILTSQDMELVFRSVAEENTRVKYQIIHPFCCRISLVNFEATLRALTSNALYYSADDMTVTIETQSSDDIVHIQVIDKGVGIAEEDLGNIFLPFFRLDSSRHREHHVTNVAGLGLDYCSSNCCRIWWRHLRRK